MRQSTKRNPKKVAPIPIKIKNKQTLQNHIDTQQIKGEHTHHFQIQQFLQNESVRSNNFEATCQPKSTSLLSKYSQISKYEASGKTICGFNPSTYPNNRHKAARQPKMSIFHCENIIIHSSKVSDIRQNDENCETQSCFSSQNYRKSQSRCRSEKLYKDALHHKGIIERKRQVKRSAQKSSNDEMPIRKYIEKGIWVNQSTRKRKKGIFSSIKNSQIPQLNTKLNKFKKQAFAYDQFQGDEMHIIFQTDQIVQCCI